MIDISYRTTKDYSHLNPPQYIPIYNIYNTILIPKDKYFLDIQPSDTIELSINNKKSIKQKVGLDSGTILFYNKEYYYFYIVPGLPLNKTIKTEYNLLLNNEKIKLSTIFDPAYKPKILNGLIVLQNNFNYLFNHTKYCLSLCDDKPTITYVKKIENKYNYYMGNTNNTLLYILNNQNTEALYAINNSYKDCYIRPLYSSNYPLGSLDISIKGVSNTRIKIGNNIYNAGRNTKVDYLPSGQYNIIILDQNNIPLNINTLNGVDYNKNTFDIIIDKAQIHQYDKQSSIQESFVKNKPIHGKCNLLINIYPYNTSFEIIGKNLKQKFNSGYQFLKNIDPGYYTIKYNNSQNEILAIKNDNNYFTNKI